MFMFDPENMPKFLFAYFVVLLILLVFLFIRLYFFQKAFVQGKIKIICRVEIDAVTGAEIIVMSLVNRSYNDINVRGFGFKYFQQDFDYMAQYFKEIDLRPTDKLYIPSRDTIEIKIDVTSLKIKLNTTNVKKFRAYAIDSMGNYIVKKAKDVEKYIETFFKQAEFVEKVENSDDKTQDKYYAKQAKFDKRIQAILDKSIKTKLEMPFVSSTEDVSTKEETPEVEETEDIATEEAEETVVETIEETEDIIAEEETEDIATEEIETAEIEEEISADDVETKEEEIPEALDDETKE